MFNPANLFKLKSAKDRFIANHPKFVQFLKAVKDNGIVENMVIDLKVTLPDGKTINSNILVKENDIELFNELSELIDGI
ncbi:MAG: hypothetical protein RR009_01035 [Oscillospiraceae bacterium]